MTASAVYRDDAGDKGLTCWVVFRPALTPRRVAGDGVEAAAARGGENLWRAKSHVDARQPPAGCR